MGLTPRAFDLETRDSSNRSNYASTGLGIHVWVVRYSSLVSA